MHTPHPTHPTLTHTQLPRRYSAAADLAAAAASATTQSPTSTSDVGVTLVSGATAAAAAAPPPAAEDASPGLLRRALAWLASTFGRRTSRASFSAGALVDMPPTTPTNVVRNGKETQVCALQ
jgi:hypothetical protein